MNFRVPFEPATFWSRSRSLPRPSLRAPLPFAVYSKLVLSDACPERGRGVEGLRRLAAGQAGARRIVLETQKSGGTPVAKLDYYQGTASTYAGFDRFGRVKDQKWHTSGTVKDRYGYGYDRNSSRLYCENALAADRSEVYDYDMLNRLVAFDRGTLNAGKTAIEGTPARQEDWALDQVGNWTTRTGCTWSGEPLESTGTEPLRIQDPVKHLDYAKREVVAARYFDIPADAVERAAGK